MTKYESFQLLPDAPKSNLKEILLKVLKAPTDKKAEEYMELLFDELYKGFLFDPERPTPFDQIKKDYWEKSVDHLDTALKIIRDYRYYTSWKAEWRKERPFKELCLQPIFLPPISLYLLSGYYLLYLIHGNQICLFDLDKLYLESLTDDDKTNNISHRFRTFKNRLEKELGDKIPCMTMNNEYAKQLICAYEYCKEINETLERPSKNSKTRRSPFIILNTDGAFEKNGFPDLDFSQKILLFFKTVAYTLLPSEMQKQAQQYSQVMDALMAETERSTLFNMIDNKISDVTQKAKIYATNMENPCLYIYCLLDYKQKAYEYIRWRKYLPRLQDIPPEGRQIYLNYISQFYVTPIGWQKSFGQFVAHQLTTEEFQKCNNSTWSEFYESNGELIDAFFPELSAQYKERLWNIARKAFVYVFPDRFNFNIKEKVQKTPEETWYRLHNINAEMTITELISMMHLIEKLKDVNAKDFWVPSYAHRHKTDTFGTMVTNIGTHPYQHFITTLHYLWFITRNIFLQTSKIQPVQDFFTATIINNLPEIW